MNKTNFSVKKITILLLIMLMTTSLMPLAIGAPLPPQSTNAIEKTISPYNQDTEYYAIIAACTDYHNDKYNIPKKPAPPIPEYKLKFLYNSLLEAENWHQENIMLLLNENASRQHILNAFDQMADIVGPDDIFLFCWSGHGSQVLDDDGDEQLYDPEDSYDEIICPYDIEVVDGEPTNFIRDDEIDNALSEIQAKGMCLIFESCLSGGLVDKTKTTTERSSYNNVESLDINAENRVVIMSTLPDTLGRASFLTGFPLLTSLALAFKGYAQDRNRDGVLSIEEAFRTARYLEIMQSSVMYGFIWMYTYIIYKHEMHKESGSIINILFGQYPAFSATLLTLYSFIQLQMFSKIFNGHYILNWPNMRDDYQGELPIMTQ